MTDIATARAQKEAAEQELARTDHILRAVEIANELEDAASNGEDVFIGLGISERPGRQLRRLADIVGVPHETVRTFELQVVADIVAKLRQWEAAQ